jgi:hypothetical protein
MLKGRIAEAIVEEMLQEAGFQVYSFGYESIIQNRAPFNAKVRRTKTGRKILKMPDFLVIKDGFPEFVEVKFRSGTPDHTNEKFKDLAETWPEAKILFVCKKEPHFRIANIRDFVEKNYLFPLEIYKYLRVERDIIKKYAKQVVASYGV